MNPTAGGGVRRCHGGAQALKEREAALLTEQALQEEAEQKKDAIATLQREGSKAPPLPPPSPFTPWSVERGTAPLPPRMLIGLKRMACSLSAGVQPYSPLSGSSVLSSI